MRNVQNRGFEHCAKTKLTGVLDRGFGEVGGIVVRIVDERRVIVHSSILVELLGHITCRRKELGQVAKLRDASAELRVSCALRTGKYGKNAWTGSSVKS